KPFLVEGYGYGVLPQIEGEAFGVVGVAGKTVGKLAGLSSTATGAIGVAATAAGVFKDLSITGKGAIGARGSSSGVITFELNGAAIGRHDDDAAALMTFLLAA